MMTRNEFGRLLLNVLIVLTFPISVPILLVAALLKYLRQSN